jgi:hypothetical protein
MGHRGIWVALFERVEDRSVLGGRRVRIPRVLRRVQLVVQVEVAVHLLG